MTNKKGSKENPFKEISDTMFGAKEELEKGVKELKESVMPSINTEDKEETEITRSNTEEIKERIGSLKNIHQRISNVMKKVHYIKKDTKVMSYKAVTHDKVIRMVRNHMIDEGIIISPSQIEIDNTLVPFNQKLLYRAKYRVDFINIDEPKDRLSVEFESHSILTDDKGPGKTFSYAVKNAILKTFLIETGEDDEQINEKNSYENHSSNDSGLVSKEEAEELRVRSEKLKKSEGVLKFLGVDKFEDAPKDKLEKARAALLKYEKADNQGS